MNSRLWKLFFILAAVVALFAAGCSDNNDNNNTPPPPRVIGTWDADTATLHALGNLTTFTYYFNSDLSYRYYREVEGTAIDERGDWTLTTDSIRFHATWRDSATVNETYTWRYSLMADTNQALDMLHVWVFTDPGYYQATFRRAP